MLIWDTALASTNIAGQLLGIEIVDVLEPGSVAIRTDATNLGAGLRVFLYLLPVRRAMLENRQYLHHPPSFQYSKKNTLFSTKSLIIVVLF
jgi:hypothetical protein